jgi:KDO2-lipid IV(A) lauroyltransferase
MAKKNALLRKFRHWAAYSMFRLVAAGAEKLPRNAGLALFYAVGIAGALFSFKERKQAYKNLESVFGKTWTTRQIKQTVWKVYGELGKNAFDAFYFSRRPKSEMKKLIRCDSLEEFKSAYEQGKGVVAITSHIGCFEMLLHYWAASGFKSFAIGRRLFDDRLDNLVKKMRSGPDIVYMYRDDSMRRIIELLKEGRVMGALIDQDTRVDGVFANFLGRLAYTPSGPIRLAMRYGLPVFVVTTYRQKNGTHYINVSKQIEIENTGDRNRDLVINVEKVNSIITQAIYNNPKQWVWMHKRWHRKPTDKGMNNVPNIENYAA